MVKGVKPCAVFRDSQIIQLRWRNALGYLIQTCEERVVNAERRIASAEAGCKKLRAEDACCAGSQPRDGQYNQARTTAYINSSIVMPSLVTAWRKRASN